MTVPDLRQLPDFTLADLEGIRVLLRGGSVVDWHRLNFANEREAEDFVRAQEVDPSDAEDVARVAQVKQSAIEYLRRHFDFPIPKPVAKKDLVGLLMLASSKGHRQICACAILKVMHIIHHLEARELLFQLPVADEEIFHLVEQKVYRVMAAALANDFPILEFIGGRKNKDSLYTKLLSKQETVAAQIYDNAMIAAGLLEDVKRRKADQRFLGLTALIGLALFIAVGTVIGLSNDLYFLVLAAIGAVVGYGIGNLIQSFRRTAVDNSQR